MNIEILNDIKRIENDLRNPELGMATKLGLRKILIDRKNEVVNSKEASELVSKLLAEFTEEKIIKSCDKDETRFY